MRTPTTLLLAVLSGVLLPRAGRGQFYDPPDRGEPGDEMIQAYLGAETKKIEADSMGDAGFLGKMHSAKDWTQERPRFRQEYFHMLGLWPLPGKTPLHATITRPPLDRGDYQVDMLHFQSRPGLYVTGNLYRPAKVAAGEKLPAILYVCGHYHRPRDGNKTACQSHGIWFARHGYICLILDSLELGEVTCTHHGTYSEGRWWWVSRGYTPAGVECWNGVRGLDYLQSRPDVDGGRLGVTGISGGGAATFWISAADERVKAAAPVSGLSDLTAYVPSRVINGHCDCMFLYNTYQWPWTRIPGMIAPRPLRFVNSDADHIFPMYGNERVINRLERLYGLFGAGDLVDAVVSVGGHDYRPDIRQAVFRFMNTHLKNDPRAIPDSEVDLVTGDKPEAHPIRPEQLRVFPQDSDIPKDAINGRIDHEFVPLAQAGLPTAEQFTAWKAERLAKLRELTFHHFPERVPLALPVETNAAGVIRLETEGPIHILLRPVRVPGPRPARIWLFAAGSSVEQAPPDWLKDLVSDRDALYVCEPRGIGSTRWTTKSPPNYVARSHLLLGRTVDSGRVWDLAAAARCLHARHAGQSAVCLAGEGAGAVWALYAGLLEPDVSSLVLAHLPASFMETSAPPLLNVLRVADLPETLGLWAPHPLAVRASPPSCADAAAAIYRAAGAAAQFQAQK